MPKNTRSIYPTHIMAVVFCLLIIFWSCGKKSQPAPVVVLTSSITVSTFAGTGAIGSADGASIVASFYNPAALTVDAQGNIYVSDTGNGIIRKVSSSGDVQTFAGTAGAHDSSLGYPFGIATDIVGNIYVGDVGNNQIMKISPLGQKSVFAGTGETGFANGPGLTASFNGPFGIAVDKAGNVYVADAGNNAIRKITPAGMVSTLAGTGSPGATNGPGTQASFSTPYGVALDGSGDVFVADTYNALIRKIGPDGVVSTVAGGGTPTSGIPGYFKAPYGLILDSYGIIYVADFDGNQIRVVTPDGEVSILAGTGLKGADNGLGSKATFNGPSGVAIDPKGDLLVADFSNNLIRIVFLNR